MYRQIRFYNNINHSEIVIPREVNISGCRNRLDKTQTYGLSIFYIDSSPKCRVFFEIFKNYFHLL